MSSYIDSGAERSGADVPVHYLGARPMADCCVGRQMQRQQFPLSVDFGPGGGPMGVEFEAAALPREEFKLKTTSTASKLKPQLAVMEIANGGFCGRSNHLDIPLRLE